MSSKLRKLPATEIACCVLLIAADQAHPFVSDEHTVLVDLGGHITLYTDTTLHTFGAVIREDGLTARPDEVFDGVMPEEVAGVHTAKCNTGVVELSGLVHTCRIIDRHPEMLEGVKNRMLDVHMDNFEDVRLLQTGRVWGEYTVEKQQLSLEFQHYMWKWNTRERVCYVNTLVNPADEPSRQGFKGETRLLRPVFRSLWAVAGGFDLDAMASCANRQSDPTGHPLPFISLGPDPKSRGMNFFGKDHGRGVNGHRERLHVNPPFVMQRSVIQWLKRCRAGGVVLVKSYEPPWPAWLVELSCCTTRSWILRSPHSEVRTGDGLVPLSVGIEPMACEFDFELPSRMVPVAAGELPATLGRLVAALQVAMTRSDRTRPCHGSLKMHGLVTPVRGDYSADAHLRFPWKSGAIGREIKEKRHPPEETTPRKNIGLSKCSSRVFRSDDRVSVVDLLCELPVVCAAVTGHMRR